MMKKIVSLFTAIVFSVVFTTAPPSVFAQMNIEIVDGSGTFEQVVNGNNTDFMISGNLIGETTNADVLADQILNVRFDEMNNGSFLLRVVDATNPTQILGTINIFDGLFAIVNARGIQIAEGAAINAFNADFLASALDILNADFLAGNYNFNQGIQNQTGIISNAGTITGIDSHIGLVGSAIQNSGDITVTLGTITLAAGKVVELDISGDQTISVAITEPLQNTVFDLEGHDISSQIHNTGFIETHGGQIHLKAASMNEILDHAVNLEGTVRATSAQMIDGVIHIGGSGGTQQDLMNMGVLEIVGDGEMNIETAGDIYSEGSFLAPDAKIEMHAGGDIETFGVLKAEEYRETADEFRIGGVYHVGLSYHDNLDDAITYSADTNVSGTITDVADIIINGGVTVTLDADTTWHADSNTDGTGAFTNSGIVAGGNNNLTLRASQASTLGTINSVNLLTLDDAGGGYDPTFTADNNLSVSQLTLSAIGLTLASDLTVSSSLYIGTVGARLTLSGNDLDLTGATFNNDGDLILNGDETLTNFTNDTDSGRVLYAGSGSYASLAAGDNYFGLQFTGTGDWSASANVDVNDYLGVGSSATFDLNGNDLDVTGALFSNTGVFRLQGGETLTAFTNDTNSGTVEYDGSGTYASLAAGNNYYNLTFSGTGDWTAGANVDINNDFTMSGANSRVHTSLTTVGGDLIITESTVDYAAADITRFDGSGTQEITSSGVGIYYIDKSTSGILELQDDLDVVSQLDISHTGAIVDLDGNDFNGPGASFSNIGTLRLNGDETITNFTNDTNSGAIHYKGFSASDYNGLAAGDSYYDLAFIGGGPGAWNLDANLDVNNELLISNTAAILDLSGFDLDLTGATFSNNGYLRMQGDETLTNFTNDTNSGMIIYDGSGSYSELIAGDNYYRLGFSGTGTWDADANIDVNNLLQISNSGATLDLNGNDLDMTGATFSNTGTLRMEGGETLTSFTNDTDSGKIEFDGSGSYSPFAAINNYYDVEFSGSGSFSLPANMDVNNSLSISNALGTLTLNGSDLDMTGATFSNVGNLEVSGTETLTNFTNDTDSGRVTYTGTGALSMVAGYDYYDLTISASGGSITLASSLDVNNDLALQTGFLDEGGQTINVGGDWTNTGATYNSGTGTVIFDGSGTQTLRSNSQDFQNLTMAGSGTLQFTNNSVGLNNDLTISSGTVDLNGQGLSVSGAFSNDGTLRLEGGETVTLTNDTDSGTVVYDGSGSYSSFAAGDNYYNLTLGGNGLWTLDAALDVNNDYVSTSDGSLTDAGFQINVGGDWNSDGGIYIGTGTVTFDGGTNQTINSGGTGTGNDFNNITVSNNSTLRLVTNALDVDNNLNILSGGVDLNGQDITVSGAFSNNGFLYLEGGETVTLTMDTDSGVVEYNGAGSYASLAAGNNYNHIQFDGTGDWTADAALDVNGDFSINEGNFIDGGQTITVGGDWGNAVSGVYTGTGTVVFDGSGTQTLYSGGTGTGNDFQNITMAGSGTLQLDSSGLYFENNFTISSGIVDLNGQDFDSSGGATFSNDGTLRLQGDENVTGFAMDTDSGTVIYDGSGTYANLAAGDNYYNLEFAGTGDWTLDGALDVNNNINITNGALTDDGYGINIGGNWQNDNNSYTGTGTVTFDGGGTQMLGSGGVDVGQDFQNIVVANGGTVQLTNSLDIDNNLTISNGAVYLNGYNMTITGAFSNDGILRLDGNESLTYTNDTDSGTVEYAGSGSYATLQADTNYYNVDFSGTGDWTFDRALDAEGSFTISNASATVDAAGRQMNIGGNFDNSVGGTFTHNSNTIIFDGTSGYIITSGQSFYDVDFSNGAGVWDLSSALDVDNSLDISSGTLDLSGYALDLTGATFTNDGTLRLQGGETLTNFTNDTDSGTVEYDGSVNQSSLAAGDAYYNLTFSGTADYDLDATLDVNQNLTISNAGAIIDLNGNNLDMTGGGTFSNDGALYLEGGETLTAFTNDTDSGTILYDGSGSYASLNAGNNYFNVEFAGTGDWTASAAMDVNNNLTITNGTFIDGGQTINMGGNWSNNGTGAYTGTGTVDFDGSGTQTLNAGGTGSGNDFQNLTYSGSGTLQFDSNAVDIDNNFTISSGTVDLNGQNLTNSGTFSNDGTLRLEGSESFAITNDTDSGTVIYDGSGTYASLALGNDYYNLTFDNATTGNWTADAALDVDGDLTISDGTFIDGGQTINFGGDWTISAGAVYTSTGNAVFDGSGSQLLQSSGNNFNGLDIQGGTLSLSDTLFASNVDISSGVLDLNGNNINVGGSLTNDATFRLEGGETVGIATMDNDSGTVEYYGAGTYASLAAGDDYYNLTFNNGTTGNWTADAALDVNNDLTITDGTFVDGGQTINVGGDWSNSDTYTGTGNVIFDGSGTQQLTSGGSSFSSLDMAGSGTLELQDALDVNTALDISSGTVDLNGNDLDLTGATFTNDSTLALEGGETLTNFTNDTDSGQVLYDGDGGSFSSLAAGNNYYNVFFGDGTWTADSDIDVNGNFVVDGLEGLGTLDLNGNNLDNTGGSFSNTGVLRLQGGETLTGFTNDTDSGTIEYDGTTNQTSLAAGDNYYNLTFSGTADYELDAALDVNQNLTISNSGAVLDLSGQDLDMTGGGTFSNTGTFQLQGDEMLTNFTNDTDSGKVLYDGTGTYGSLVAGDNYYQLEFNGTGTWDAAANVDVNNELRIDGGGTFDLNGNDLDLTGATYFNDGVFRLQGDETLTNFTNHVTEGITEYDGSGSYASLPTGGGYYGLTFNGSGDWTLDSNIDVENDFVITSGTVNASDKQININEDWTNNGTFNAGTGTVVFDGVVQELNGDTVFNNLTITDTLNTGTDKILTVEAGSTTSVTGLLTVQGIDSDDRVNLVSSSPGSQWNLNASGTFAVDYVDVTDSDASSGSFITNTNTVDGGNNLNWFVTTFVWAGTTSSVFSLDSNWVGGLAPSSGNDVQIANVTNDPILGAGFTFGDLTIDSGGDLDLAGYDITVSGAFSNDGILRLEGGETLTSFTNDTDSGTIIYDGAGSYSGLAAGDAYNNLTFDGTGDWTLDAALDVDGNITLANGTLDVSGSSRQINVAGNWTDTGGTFTERSGTVVFDGTSIVTSNGDDFYNVDIGDATNGGSVTTADDMIIQNDLTVGTAASTSFDISDDTVTFYNDADFTNLDTFTATNSTVVIDPLNGSTSFTAVGISFNDVLVDNSGGTTNDVFIASDLDIDGDLTIQNTSAADFDFRASGASRTIDVAGNLLFANQAATGEVNVGTVGSTLTFDLTGATSSLTFADANTDVGSLARFEFGGTGTQSLDTTAWAGFNGDIEVDKASGSLQLANDLTLDESSVIFTVTNGTFDVNGNSLDFSNSAELQQDGGSIDLGSANHTLDELDLNAGTFTSTSGTLTMTEDFDHDGGTFVNNGGTVMFDPSGGTISLDANGVTFNDVEMDNSSGSSNIVLITGDMDIDGDLTIQNTSNTEFNIQANTTLTVDVAGDLLFANDAATGVIDVGGIGSSLDFDLTGATSSLTFNDANIDVDSVAGFKFSGTGTQTLDSSAWSAFNGDFDVDKASGTMQLANDLTLDGSSTIFTLTNGTFDVNGNSLNFSNSAELQQDGGTINLGSVNHSLDILDLNGGTFNSTTGTLTMTDDFDHDGGTFVNNGGTVMFDPSGGTISLDANGVTFNDVEMDNSSGSSNIVLITGDMDIDGDLTIQNTSNTEFNIQANTTLTVDVAGDLLFANDAATGVIDVGGIGSSLDFDLTGATSSLTFNDANIDVDSVAGFKFSGTGTQTLDSSAWSAFNGDFDVDKASGTMQLANDLTLDGSSTIFTLTNGTFDVNGNSLNFSNSAELQQDGGTINLGSVNHSLDILDLNGGTFNSTTGTLTMTDDFDHDGSTFVHNNGTVMFDPSGGSISLDANGITFNDVEMDNSSGSTNAVLITGDMDIDGDLTIQNTSNTEFNIQSTTTATVDVAGDLLFANDAATGVIDVGGAGSSLDFDLTGATSSLTFNDSNIDVDSVAGFDFRGTGTQTLTATALSFFNGDIDVNKASGTLQLGSDLTIGGSSAIFTMTSGAFDVNGNTLNFSNDARFQQDGGTVNLGSVDHTLEILDLNAGTFTSTSGTLTMTDDFDHDGATFVHNSGTVMFDPSGGTIALDADGMTFNDVEMDNSSGSSNVVLITGDMDIDGDLTVQNTSNTEFNIQSNTSATVDVAGDLLFANDAATGVIDVGGAGSLLDFDLTGATSSLTFNDSNIDVDSVAGFKFSGTGTQGLDALAWSAFAGDIDIDKASGAVQLGSDLTLDNSNVLLTVTDGTFDVNGNSLDFSNNVELQQDGGVISLGSVDHTLELLDLNGGTFNSTSGTLTMIDDFDNDGTAFVHNSGTVVFDPQGGAILLDSDGSAFNNVVFDNTADTTNDIILTSNMDIDGNLTVQNTSTNQLDVDGSYDIDVAGNFLAPSTGATGVVDLDAPDIYLSGATSSLTISDSNFNMGSSSEFRFLGSGTQNVTLNAFNEFASDFIVNKASGSVELQTDFTPTSSLAVLTITSGTFDLNGNDLTMFNSKTLSNDGVFRLQGDETITNLAMDTNSGTVFYDGTSSYSGLAAGDNYYNLTIDGVGGVWTADANLDVNNTLSIVNGTLDLGGNDLDNTGGSFSNTDTLRLEGGETLTGFTNDTDSGTVVYDGATNQTSLAAGDAYNNLTFSGTADYELDANLDVNGVLSVNNASAILDLNGNDLDNTGGSFSNIGLLRLEGGETLTSFTNDSDSGAVEYDGSVNQTSLAAGDTYNNLTFSGTANYELDASLDVNGALSVNNASAILDLNGNDFDNTGGSFSNVGTFQLQGGETLTAFTNDTDSGTTVYDGSGSYGSLAAGNNYYNVDFNGTGSWDASGNVDINNSLDVSNGTFDINGNDLDLTGATFTNDGTIRMQGDETLTNFTNDTGSGTVDYDGSGTYTGLIAGDVYNDLTFSGTGTWNLDANLDVNDALDIDAGATVDLSGNDLDNTGGSFANDGTLRLEGGETLTNFTNDTDSGTILYDGTGIYAGLGAGDDYYNLTIDGVGGVWNADANLDVNNVLSIVNGTLDLSGNDLDNTGGSFTNDGTLRLEGGETLTNFTNDTDSGLVDYDGSGTYTGLAAGDAYNDVTFSGTGTWNLDANLDVNDALDIDAGSTLDLSGNDLDNTGGSFTNDGTLRLEGGETLTNFTNDTDSGLVDYDGSGTYTGLAAGDNYNDVTFSGSGTWNLDSNLDVNDALDIDAGATLDLSGNDLDNTGGSFANDGTLRLEGGETLTNFTNDTDSGTTVYDGTGTYGSLAAGNTYNNVDFNGTGTWNAGGNVDVNNSLDISNGTFDINGNDLDLTGATFTNDGTIRMQGDETLTNFTNDTDSGTVDYDGSGTYTGLIAGDVYNDLTFSGTGTWNLDANLDVNDALDIDSGSTLDLSGNDLDNTGGSFTNDGTLRLEGGETLTNFTNDTDSGLVDYDGSGTYTGLAAGDTYNDVTFSGSGTWNLDANLDVNDALDIDAGATVDLSGNDLDNAGGSFTNDGTLRLEGGETLTNFTNDTDSGLVDYDGSGTYTGLAAGDNYNDVTFSGTGTWNLDANLDVNDALDIDAGSTLDLSGNDLDNTGGSFTNDGTLRLEGGETLTNFTNDTDSGLVDYDGSGTYTGLAAGDNYNDVTFSGTGTWNLDANLDVNDALDIDAGSTLDLSGNDLDNTGGSFTNDGTLRLEGGETLTNFTNDTGSGLVDYDGSGTYTGLAAGDAYNDVTFSGTGTWNLDSNLDVNDALDIDTGSTLDLAGNDLDNTGGSFTNDGTLRLEGGETFTNFTNDTDSGLVDYDGSGTYTGLAAGDAYNDVTFSGTGTWNLDANLDVNDALDIDAGATVDLSGNDLDNTGGSFTNDGTLRLEGGETLTNFTNDTDSGLVDYDGSGTYTGLAAGDNYNDVTFSGSGTWNLDANLDVNDALDIDVGATVDLSGNDLDNTGGSFTNDGTLRLEGGETLTNFTNDTDSGLVDYDGSGTYTGLAAGDNYNDVTFSGSGTWNLDANLDVNDAMDIDAGATVDLSGNDLDNTGSSFTNDGTLRLEGGETLTNFTNDTDSGLVDYDGSGTYTGLAAGDIYNDVTFSGSGTWNLDANADINDDFEIGGGATVGDGGFDLNVGGDWTNNGTFNATGEVILDGGTQNINGDTTFNDLTKTTPGGTLNVESGSTQRVDGHLNLEGASGNEMTVWSDNPGVGAWNLNLQGTSDLDYLILGDVNSIGLPVTATNSTDAGNTTGINFGAPAAPPADDPVENTNPLEEETLCPGPNCPDNTNIGDGDGDGGNNPDPDHLIDDEELKLDDELENEGEEEKTQVKSKTEAKTKTKTKTDSGNSEENADFGWPSDVCHGGFSESDEGTCRAKTKTTVKVYEGAVYVLCADSDGNPYVCEIIESGSEAGFEWKKATQNKKSLTDEEKAYGYDLYEKMRKK